MSRFSVWILVQLFCLILRADANIKADDGPTESECQPYIEKALHELHPLSQDATNGSPEAPNIRDQIISENIQGSDSNNSEEIQSSNDETVTTEGVESSETHEASVEDLNRNLLQTEDDDEKSESVDRNVSTEENTSQQKYESGNKDSLEQGNSPEREIDAKSTEVADLDEASGENASGDTSDDENNSQNTKSEENDDAQTRKLKEDTPDADGVVSTASVETADNLSPDKENDESSKVKTAFDDKSENENFEKESEENASPDKEMPSSENLENSDENAEPDEKSDDAEVSSENSQENLPESKEESTAEDEKSKEILDESIKSNESNQNEDESASDEKNGELKTEIPEDELLSAEVPSYELRNRSHISEILNLDNGSKDKIINNVAEIILRDLKRIYENSIKPLELLYKYRDLSNRHFGDSEIFAKPLILLMGPWSAGKSSIINYLTENENSEYSLRSGAEPSPAYFNLVMYGDEPEVLDGTQLVADFTFSGLQKFGQGLEERLHGLKLPNKLLKKVNIVEIPGILEVRKQVSRQFPFNDACQWFIDRADMIFLAYDPSKLDVGLETEAILDQLKGREYQTRIILNKADKVKPDELLRVQSALMWNISPLMSSTQPPVMYTVSLWGRLFEAGAPTRLLQAQENALLKDMRLAIDKRIENKIASARRFAVRVRNHAKMVDCYLTTYYNHKSLFGNKKRIADQIIENPQNYHIYEGLSTLTNISRYDLPDPEMYREFFHLNPLFEFKKLSETCTYFRGCPINKLDIAIAYDLPDLVGKYKREIDSAFTKNEIPGSS